MNLLVLTSRYPHTGDFISSSFAKNQVDSLKKKCIFDKIYVISLNPYVPRIFSNISAMNPRWRRDTFAIDYSYNDIEVYFAKYLSLPLDAARKRVGDSALKAASKIILDKGIDFDLIHAHFTYPSGYVGANLKETYAKPMVLTIHEDREWFLREAASGDAKINYAWKTADRIIRVNMADLKVLENAGIARGRLVYIPNGFSPTSFKPSDTIEARKMLGIPDDKRILLNVAALEEYKGQKYLLLAMRAILALRKDIMLYIVGQGSLERTLQALINKYGMQDSIVLAGGNKPTDEINLWMNACDAFVLSSLSEGNPTVMFEAMACGKPIVATRCGGCEEMIIDEKLGILVEPENADLLAKAILTALETEWDAMFIMDYADQFTWDKITGEILRVYADALGNQGAL